MGNKDSLGDRMKNQYEHRTRYLLPRRTYTLIRLDGKAFHSYTKGCKRPYDLDLMSDMDETAKFLCEQIQGCKIAYVQSDEISLILTDFATPTTDAYFDGNVQKINSVSSSMATAKFNMLRLLRSCYQIDLEEPYRGIYTDNINENYLAFFDSRVFTIPDLVEVCNYMVWRQQDATRNSIQMTGQAKFSHKELQGKSCDQIQEMLFQEKGINWNDLPVGFKRGRCVVKETYQCESTFGDRLAEPVIVDRTRWVIKDPPVFTQEPDFIKNIISGEEAV